MLLLPGGDDSQLQHPRGTPLGKTLAGRDSSSWTELDGDENLPTANPADKDTPAITKAPGRLLRRSLMAELRVPRLAACWLAVELAEEADDAKQTDAYKLEVLGGEMRLRGNKPLLVLVNIV